MVPVVMAVSVGPVGVAVPVVVSRPVVPVFGVSTAMVGSVGPAGTPVTRVVVGVVLMVMRLIPMAGPVVMPETPARWVPVVSVVPRVWVGLRGPVRTVRMVPRVNRRPVAAMVVPVGAGSARRRPPSGPALGVLAVRPVRSPVRAVTVVTEVTVVLVGMAATVE